MSAIDIAAIKKALADVKQDDSRGVSASSRARMQFKSQQWLAKGGPK